MERTGTGRGGLVCLLAAATAFTFWPVRTHGFLNWDDPDLLIDNASLQQPAGPLLRWALTTRHMGHYQPLSWLAFAVGSGTPPSASRVHTIGLALHVLNAALLLLADCHASRSRRPECLALVGGARRRGRSSPCTR